MSRDPLDDLFAIGSVFDWISPATALFRPGVRDLYITNTNGYTCAEVEWKLRRAGIRTYGAQIVEDALLIGVRKSQWQRAAAVLTRLGVG